jgi:hypothetical protein
VTISLLLSGDRIPLIAPPRARTAAYGQRRLDVLRVSQPWTPAITRFDGQLPVIAQALDQVLGRIAEWLSGSTDRRVTYIAAGNAALSEEFFALTGPGQPVRGGARLSRDDC